MESCKKGADMGEAKHKPMSELLEMHPEFKPLWEAAGDNKNLKYYVRLMVLKHHKESQ